MSEPNVIYEYTREQAIADGVLVDVTEWAGPRAIMGGFAEGVSVVLTAALWADIEAMPRSLEGLADVRGRGHDVIWMACCAVRVALRRNPRAPVDRLFQVILPSKGTLKRKRTLRVVLNVEGVTIGHPEDF